MASIKMLSAQTTRTIEAIVAQVPGDGTPLYVGEKDGPYMRLVVEKIAPDTYSFAHYYTQNGDAMRDPEMIFFRLTGGFWSTSYFLNDGMGIEQDAVRIVRDAVTGKPISFENLLHVRVQSDMCDFAGTWMRNIRAQHPDFFAPKAPPAAPPAPRTIPCPPPVVSVAPPAVEAPRATKASAKTRARRASRPVATVSAPGKVRPVRYACDPSRRDYASV
jgi:hypothetical protein